MIVDSFNDMSSTFNFRFGDGDIKIYKRIY